MTCRLCLSNTEKLIPIYDENGKDAREIAAIVNKFIGDEVVELNANDGLSSVICISCWGNIDNFKKFCTLIAEKHKEQNTKKLKRVLEVTSESLSDLEQSEDEVEVIIRCSEREYVEDVLLNESEHNSNKLNDHTTDVKNVKNREGTPHNCIRSEKSENIKTEKVNARKIGRPRKIDAATRLNEDHLIAEHMQLQCDICKLQLKTFSNLSMHFKISHNSTGYAVCCNKRLYKRGLLIDHINFHKNPDYFKCESCGMNFSDRVCLRNHILLKHKSAKESPYQCDNCGKKFAKIYFLQRHALKHTPGDECTFLCELCNKSYPNLSRLKTHQKNVHGDGCLKVCNHWGELVRGNNSFERHIEQHEGTTSSRNIQCTVCKEWLSNKYCLRLHMERHGDKKIYTCKICGKETPSRLAMNAHHRYHHSIAAESKYKCTYCVKTFKTPRRLKEHLTTHTGETLYTCSYCEKKFKCSSNLHSHRKWQHPTEWARDMLLPKSNKI